MHCKLQLGWHTTSASTYVPCLPPPLHQHVLLARQLPSPLLAQQTTTWQHDRCAALHTAPAVVSDQHAYTAVDDEEDMTSTLLEKLSPGREGAANDSEVSVSFEELGVDRLFLTGLAKMGIHDPAAIQQVSIPAILSGKNCAVQSYTGSGKTLSYLLPVLTLALQRAEARIKAGATDVPIQALVVAPSQELAMQIVRVARDLFPPKGRTAVQQVIGGANPWRQAEALALNKPLLVVGTPGRLAEMVRNGTLRLHQCPLMVLDEADQMLTSAFSLDMTHLAEHCGKKLHEPRQTVVVSATLTETVMAKLNRWSSDLQYISSGPRISTQPNKQAASSEGAAAAAGPSWGWGVTGWDGPASPLMVRTVGSAGGVEQEELVPAMPPQLQHFYVVVEPHHKVDMLRRCMYAMDTQRALVFMNFQQRLKDTQFKLEARNMQVAALHGEMNKLQRQNMLNDFKRGRLRALVVSDVAARGLDVPACDAVFNLEQPSSAAHYAHRAGRTGRMGAPGMVVSIISGSERFVVEKLSKKLDVPMLEAHVSHGNFHLGPPPESYNFKADKESDRAAFAAKRAASDAASEAKASSSSSTPSSTADLSKARAGQKLLSSQTQHEADRARNSVGASTSQRGVQGSKAQSEKGNKAPELEDEDEDEVIYDEDDEIEDEDEDEPMQSAMRRARAPRRGTGLHPSLRGTGKLQVGRGKGARQTGGAGSDDVDGSERAKKPAATEASVLSELQRELAELKAEKDKLKEARRGQGEASRR